MNKKINLLLVGLLVFCIPFISVQAKATYPKSNPTVNKDLYVTVDEKFDFSKVKFGEAVGSSELKKIFLGDYDSTNPYNLKDSFTAYCLDASKLYPDQGYQYVSKLGTTAEAKTYQALISTVFNSEFNYKSSELSGFKYLGSVEFENATA